nr:hypothetical protein [Tanacetum cinerariifolium]
MVSYLTKSDASEGFNQVINFLNGSYIKLQALVDRKKVVITKGTIRDALCLGDAKGVDCLPNEEIFAELARIGYEKPSTKLTFYKAFFSSQWKFLIHTILQSMSAKRTSWNEFSLAMASAVICLSTDAAQEPSIPSPTLYTPPPEPPQDLPSTSQVQHSPPQSTQAQLKTQSQSQQATDFPMSHLQEALDACAALTRRVEHLEYDKVAQALEIKKLKRRVKKLEKGNKVKVLKLRRLQKVGTSQRIDTSDDTVMEDAPNQGRMIDALDSDAGVALMDDKKEEKKAGEDKVAGDDQVQGRQAKIYKIDMDHALKVLSMKKDEPEEVQEVVEVVTTAKLITEVVTAASESITAASTTISAVEPQVPTAIITAAPVRVAAASTRRRKGVVIRDLEEESSTVIPADTKSKDKGKRNNELNKDIDWDVAIDHVKQKAKEDPFMQIYQVMKKRPHTEAQARKNMIMYLKNVVGFRLDYFKGMSYDDIRPIFEAKFNSNIAFLLKSKEQLEEEENRVIESINETPA